MAWRMNSHAPLLPFDPYSDRVADASMLHGINFDQNCRLNVMLITEIHFCGLCGDQVSAVTIFVADRAYAFIDLLGRSVMTKITTTFGRLLISALPLLVLCAMGSTVANAQAIGKATSVKPQAEANARTLSAGSDVFSQETIHTGDSGVADLRFHDNSNLSVGPKSSVRLDKYVTRINRPVPWL
jgi:hypothetical protein